MGWLKLRDLGSEGAVGGVREAAAPGARGGITALQAVLVSWRLNRLETRQSCDTAPESARLCEDDQKKDRQVGGLLLKVRTHLDPICSYVD